MILKERPSSITFRDPDGWSPLMVACMEGHLDLVKLLIENGADPNDADNNGWNCITFASENNRDDILDYLTQQSNK